MVIGLQLNTIPHSETERAQGRFLCEINIHKITDQILRMKMVFLDISESRKGWKAQEGEGGRPWKEPEEQEEGGAQGLCQVMTMALHLATVPPFLVCFFFVS